MFGFLRDGRSKLRVKTDCGINLSHKCIGNVGSTEQSPVMKWFFHVLMALSAAFRLCEKVGTS